MRLPEVRPDERQGTLAAFLTIFGMLAGHTLLETARDALFLARLPASHLAFVYLAIAAAAVGVAQVPWGRARERPLRTRLLLGAGAIVTFLFWLLLRGQSPLEIYALYVWTGLLGSLAVLQFWMVLGDLYTLGEAKRLYSLVWTGSLLGATAEPRPRGCWRSGPLRARWCWPQRSCSAVTALGPALALGRVAGRSAARPRGAASLGEGWRC